MPASADRDPEPTALACEEWTAMVANRVGMIAAGIIVCVALATPTAGSAQSYTICRR